MNKASIETLIAELHAYVKASEDNLTAENDDGAVEEMGKRVTALCQQIAQLNREQAKEYEAPLQEALEAVEGLQKKLQEQREKTLDALGNVKQHSQAIKAYAKPLGN